MLMKVSIGNLSWVAYGSLLLLRRIFHRILESRKILPRNVLWKIPKNMRICCVRCLPVAHLIVILIILSTMSMVRSAETAYDRLFADVWSQYGSTTRPVCGQYPATVKVKLGLSLQQPPYIDEKHQLMISSIWVKLKWHDCRLTWNTSDYNDAPSIILPSTVVWTPDLILYPNREKKFLIPDRYKVYVGHDGNVSLNVAMVVTTPCNLNVRYFPFDIQSCLLQFGSRVYGNQEVNFTEMENFAGISQAIQHGEWDVVDVVAQSTEVESEGVTFSERAYIIHLKRNSKFYVIILILPSLMQQSLSIANFILPPESGEKIRLEMTVLLSLSVFQLVILETMPATSENMPIMASCLILSMVLVTMSCIATVVVLRVHSEPGTMEVPYRIRLIMEGWFGRLFGVNKLMEAAHLHTDAAIAVLSDPSGLITSSPDLDVDKPQQCQYKGRQGVCEDSTKNWNHPLDMDYSLDALYESSTDESQRKPQTKDSDMPNTNSATLTDTNPETKILLQTARQMMRCVEKLHAQYETENARDVIREEWRILALLMDRVFLTFFLVLDMIFLLVFCVVFSLSGN